LTKAEQWLARRYQLERDQILFFKHLFKQQWKAFIAQLQSGVPLEQALNVIDVVNQQFKDDLVLALQRAASSGVNQAQAAVQAAAASTSAVPNVQLPMMSIDWALVNENAKEWAQQYAYSEIGGITATTRKVLRQKVGDWLASGQPLQQLMRDKQLVQLFGPQRAMLIAVTEVTRVYAEANQLVFQQTGVQKRSWNTAADELVCPICGPLNGTVVGITEPFPGGIMLPPAHPNCRCWITPVVSEELDGTEHSG